MKWVWVIDGLILAYLFIFLAVHITRLEKRVDKLEATHKKGSANKESKR